MLRCNLSCIDRASCGKRISQKIGLRIGSVFQSCAATGVRLAGDKKLLEAVWPAEGIAFFEELDNGLAPQLEGSMAVRMHLGNERAQIATAIGHWVSIGQFSD